MAENNIGRLTGRPRRAWETRLIASPDAVTLRADDRGDREPWQEWHLTREDVLRLLAAMDEERALVGAASSAAAEREHLRFEDLYRVHGGEG